MSDLQHTHAQKKRNLDSLEVSPLQPHRFAVQTQAQQPSLKTQTELCEHYQRTKQLGAKKENISVHNPEQALKIQSKLTISQPGDEYEQEANRVAAAVVRRMNNSDVEQSDQSKSVQRQELSQEEKEPISTESEAINVPKEEEATLQTKSLSSAIQRQEIGEEEEKLEAEPEAGVTEEVPEEQEEQLQTKLETGATQLQMRSDHKMTATADLETSIQQARGGGQTMADTIRQPMEQSFGVNFSSVRIHTDAQSDTLNKSIQARAFTTGQDIFFKQGEYNPGSQSGQELLAHELTHVVQQNNNLQRQASNQPSGVQSNQSEIIANEIKSYPLIKARYKTAQVYKPVRNQVESWGINTPADYIEDAIQEWNANRSVHHHFGRNFDGDSASSYLNLRRLYKAKNIDNLANYIANNIVKITFFNRSFPGHQDLKKALDEAQIDLKKAGHNLTFNDAWSFVPRTIRGNINILSNHALGKAVDFNHKTNPQIKKKRDKQILLVINTVCSSILPNGLLAEKNFDTLQKASEHFKKNFTSTWINQQEQLMQQLSKEVKQLEKQQSSPPSLNTQKQKLKKQTKLVRAIKNKSSKLNQYAATGFLDLSEALVTSLVKAKLTWGGSWTSQKDFMHFEL